MLVDIGSDARRLYHGLPLARMKYLLRADHAALILHRGFRCLGNSSKVIIRLARRWRTVSAPDENEQFIKNENPEEPACAGNCRSIKDSIFVAEPALWKLH